MLNNPLNLVESTHRVALVTHAHPDGDAYGSLLGLKQILSDKVMTVDAYADKNTHSKFSFLPEYDDLKDESEMSDVPYDICFVLDCGNKDRVQGYSSLLTNSKKVVNIDHHVSNTGFGQVAWVDSSASSTSEIIAHLANECNYLITAGAATCLLMGIMMDTGNFLYDSTTKKTHLVTALLLDQGADHASIRYHLFQNRPLQNVKLLGYLIERMELLMDNQVVLLSVSDDLLNSFKVAYEDLDEFIAYTRDIAGVELAIILKELSPDEIKVSFRSKKWLDVNKLASHFTGGGHERAAGAVIEGTLQEARDRMIPVVKAAFDGGKSI